eukprot:3335431-Rhodomonas_salina.1
MQAGQTRPIQRSRTGGRGAGLTGPIGRPRGGGFGGGGRCCKCGRSSVGRSRDGLRARWHGRGHVGLHLKVVWGHQRGARGRRGGWPSCRGRSDHEVEVARLFEDLGCLGGGVEPDHGSNEPAQVGDAGAVAVVLGGLGRQLQLPGVFLEGVGLLHAVATDVVTAGVACREHEKAEGCSGPVNGVVEEGDSA